MNDNIIDDKIMLYFSSIFSKMITYEKKQLYEVRGVHFTSSDVHLIDTIGRFPEANVTELSKHQGLTKGAISQRLKRLEEYKLIRRYNDASNNKEVMVHLTDFGWEVFNVHMESHIRLGANLIELLKEASPENKVFLNRVLSTLDQHIDDINADLDKKE